MQTFLDFGTRSIEAQFWAFHAANPGVYLELVQLAYRARARGRRRWGIGALWEVLRWQRMLRTDDPNSDLKLNNNFRAHYARLIMDNEPDLAGFFEIRELRAR